MSKKLEKIKKQKCLICGCKDFEQGFQAHILENGYIDEKGDFVVDGKPTILETYDGEEILCANCGHQYGTTKDDVE